MALLYSSVFADNALAIEEELEFDALLTRARTFHPVPPDAVSGYIESFQRTLAGHNQIYPLSDVALDNLPPDPDLAHALFCHCADLVFADNRLNTDELEFLDYLAKRLLLPERTRLDVLQVMQWKHRF